MKKRSVSIAGHLTSITLEDEFWAVLKRIAARRNLALNELIGQIDEGRGENNLSSALRIFILEQALSGLGNGTESMKL